MICNNRAFNRALPTSLFALAMAVLGGCSSVSSYDPGEPAGVELAGTWRLNAAESDDPRKVLEKYRQQRRSAPDTTQVAGPHRRGQSSQDATPLPEDPAESFAPMRSPLYFVPNADVLRNEVLSIKQQPDAFVIDFGTSVGSYTPGSKSVVSVPEGVGDQSAGWHGKEFVIEVRSQLGLQMSEAYSLSNKQGRQLVVKLHVSGYGVPTLNLKRVYDPTTTDTPRALPSIE